MRTPLIDRRDFLRAAGASFVASLAPVSVKSGKASGDTGNNSRQVCAFSIYPPDQSRQSGNSIEISAWMLSWLKSSGAESQNEALPAASSAT